VTQYIQAIIITLGDDRQLDIILHQERGIHQFAIHAPGQGCASQAGTNGLGDFGNRNRLIVFPLTSVWQCYPWHGSICLNFLS